MEKIEVKEKEILELLWKIIINPFSFTHKYYINIVNGY
jgi:hypothetical protein